MLAKQKRLRKFALNLDRYDWPNEFGYDLYLRSRALCNFVERELIKTEVFFDSSKLVLNGAKTDRFDFKVNSFGVACLRAPFDEISYRAKTEAIDVFAFMRTFIRTCISGISAEKSYNLTPVLDAVDKFFDGHCVNEWLYQSKTIIRKKLVAKLICRISQHHFTLTLATERDGQAEHSTLILSTDPDPLAYHYEFKDMKLHDNKLIITNRKNGILCEIPVTSLVQPI
ncbi:hypothetical protein GCM10027046_05050 [Uliginosibacterium flavum]